MGRYCPQLLADYLLLAAAPPSGRSKALLHFSSPAAALAARCASGEGGHSSGAAAAAAAEDALSGEPLSPAVAAALRRGASALYGACSASEVRRGWRAAIPQNCRSWCTALIGSSFVGGGPLATAPWGPFPCRSSSCTRRWAAAAAAATAAALLPAGAARWQP